MWDWGHIQVQFLELASPGVAAVDLAEPLLIAPPSRRTRVNEPAATARPRRASFFSNSLRWQLAHMITTVGSAKTALGNFLSTASTELQFLRDGRRQRWSRRRNGRICDGNPDCEHLALPIGMSACGLGRGRGTCLAAVRDTLRCATPLRRGHVCCPYSDLSIF